LTHNGSRVFASATPHSLEIWAEAQMGTIVPKYQRADYVIDDLRSDASDLVTFQYLRDHRQERPPPTANALSQRSSPSGTTEDGESESDAQSMADDDDDDVFKLVVRSAVTKDVILKVRPTTSCGAIVKAFLKRAGIADQYSENRNVRGPQLMVDGEHMNPDTPISEADLEDGCQVEVAGLQYH
jgi:Ubiquitin-2 like Rad60 SUMO-like